MKNCIKKPLKASNGITLIALVITIIVLLILAGISISMLSGDNGILQKATEAKENTDNSQIKERVRLAYNSALTKDLTNGNGDLTKPTLDEEINNEFGSRGKVEQDGNYWVIYVDNNEIEKISISESALAPTLISQGAKVGDYVNYNSASGKGSNLQVTASDIAEILPTIDNSSTETKNAGGATISGTFTSNDIEKWRIISTDGGTIKLIAVLPTTQSVKLQGFEGFKKCIQVLNVISAIYGKGNGAIEAKSVTIDDLKFNFNNINGNDAVQEYSTGFFFKQITENGKIIGYENNLTEANNTEKITIQKHMAYMTGGSNMFDDSDNAEVRWQMYSDTSFGFRPFFFANQGVRVENDHAWFSIPDCSSPGGLSHQFLFDSRMPNYSGDGSNYTAFVKPIVTLQSGIRGQKAEDGSWNLDV